MPRYRRLLRLRFGRGAELERELDDEIHTHIELRTEELVREGMDPEEARQEAERRFGDLVRSRARIYAEARTRERRTSLGEMLDAGRQHGLVMLRRARRSPGLAAVSIGIFALGVSLATMIFALVDHVVLRPLPYPEPDRLVSLQSVGESGRPFDQTSMENWVDWRAGARSLAATAIHRTFRVSVTLGGEALRATGTSVSGDFFLTLKPRVVAGRGFSSEDGQAREPVAVVSTGFAVRHFGSAAAAVGGPIVVSGTSRRIVGVVADRQAYPEGTEVWTPEAYRPGSGGMRNNINYAAIGRLADDVDIATARDELSAIARGIMSSDPEAAYSYAVGVVPLRDVVVGDAAEYLWVLFAAVGGVLLVACANLAGLSLAQSRQRAREVAVRLALGSSRGRVVAQLLAEHLGLALTGGAVGLAATWLASGVVFARIRGATPRTGDVAVDWRVAAFAVLVSGLAGVLAGVLPALRTSSVTPGRTLGSTRGTVLGGRGLPGGALVAGEVALALVLLVGGGLLLRSFQALLDRDLGFDPEGVLTAEIVLTGPQYDDPDQAIPYWTALLEELEAIPAVGGAAVANWIPTGGAGTSFLELPDDPEPDFGSGYRVVSDDYFEVMDIPLLAGRGFEARDVADGERVTVVNAALAERAWPGESPLGKQIRPVSMESWMYDNEPPWLVVIGVVGDVRHGGFEQDADRELFVLHRQVPAWTTAMTAVVRGTGSNPEALAAAVRERARAIDPSLAVEVGSLDRRVADLLRERRMTLTIILVFSFAALFLTCLGIYGLVSFAASQRTREMAIRTALGARRGGLLGLMLGGAARIIGVGAVVGLAAAYWLTGLIESLLVDVPKADLPTYVAAATLLGVVGLLAAAVPSARASRLDPMAVLHEE